METFDDTTPGCSQYTQEEDSPCQMLKVFKVHGEATGKNNLSPINDKGILYGDAFRSWQKDMEFFNSGASAIPNLPYTYLPNIETRLKIYEKASGQLHRAFSLDERGNIHYACQVRSDITCHTKEDKIECEVFRDDERSLINDIIRDIDIKGLDDERSQMSQKNRHAGDALYGFCELVNLGVHWLNDRVIQPSHAINAFRGEPQEVPEYNSVDTLFMNLLLDCHGVAPPLLSELSAFVHSLKSQKTISAQWSLSELLFLSIIENCTLTADEVLQTFLYQVIDIDTGLTGYHEKNLFSLNENDEEPQVRGLKTNRLKRQDDSFLIYSDHEITPGSGNKRLLIQLMLESMAKTVIKQSENDEAGVIKRAVNLTMEQKKQRRFTRRLNQKDLERQFHEKISHMKDMHSEEQQHDKMVSNLLLISQLMPDASVNEQHNVMRWVFRCHV